MTMLFHPTRTFVLAASTAAVLVAGCADMNPSNMSQSQRNTAIGAGLGALAGAAIGGNAKGAVIGGALGAAGGYVWSRQMQDKKLAMERATRGSGVAVTQTADNQLKLNIPSDISFDTGRAVEGGFQGPGDERFHFFRGEAGGFGEDIDGGTI